jgi:transposase InsO family protein
MECRKMSLKMEFVEKASRPGARVAELCRQYEISRETGYKWLNRFKREGYDGLEEKSRAPQSSPLAKAEEMVHGILQAREAHPRWGPKKLRDLLRRRLGDETPSVSTIARVLRRFGHVRERRRRRPLSVIERAPSVEAKAPNDVWTVDFKGWWRALDRSRCEPLTVRDAFSRFVLTVKVMEGTAGDAVRDEFEDLFRKHGLPSAIQCDNGPPFISVQGRGGLTALSAWWISLGIKVIRSRPGCPQDNGAHERMHRDMSADLEAFPEASREKQQHACSKWKQEFNHVRPHEALGGKVPGEIYKPSTRHGLTSPAFSYPKHWIVRRAFGKEGCICVDGENYHVGRALTGHTIALEPLDGMSHRIWFRELDLGKLELAPPRRLIDNVVDALLERPFTKTDRRIRPRSDSSAHPGPPVSLSAVPPQDPSLPPGPPQLPPDTCAQQTLGSSAVSSAAVEVQPA